MSTAHHDHHPSTNNGHSNHHHHKRGAASTSSVLSSTGSVSHKTSPSTATAANLDDDSPEESEPTPTTTATTTTPSTASNTSPRNNSGPAKLSASYSFTATSSGAEHAGTTTTTTTTSAVMASAASGSTVLGPDYFHIVTKFYLGLPDSKIEPTKGISRAEYLSEPVELPMLCGRSVSTYPIVPVGSSGLKARDGEPNADSFSAILYENRALIAIADGCNWGEKSQKAARNAIEGVMEYIPGRTESVTDLREIGRRLLRAICEANTKILSNATHMWDAGTTTLLLCFMIPLADTSDWGAVIASVGDCKAFHWNFATHEVLDITSGNRCVDLRDPGGRLGPYVGQGSPDLRNLQLYYHVCKPGDVVMLVTDGIYDNFDPVQLGNTPRDMGIDANAWPQVPKPVVETTKKAFLAKFINDLYSTHPVTPASMVNVAVDHAIVTTTPTRDFMEANPGQKQPSDYKKYPGKMDHTTAVAYRVGPVDFSEVVGGKRVPVANS
ncbi:cyclophilin B [Pelomyxa schiedti]|nr:cyclophilin B [Pelomyxa schiedti]